MKISLEEYIAKNNKTSSWSKIYPIILSMLKLNYEERASFKDIIDYFNEILI